MTIHSRWLTLALLSIAVCGGRNGAAQTPAHFEMVNKWIQAGTAAGNDGDWYDNRDGQHSPLKFADRYPRLQIIKDASQGGGHGIQTKVLDHVTFGNASLASANILIGSMGRSCYAIPGLMQVLHQQYRKNNLYIYPEHRDHDAGVHGDLFPLNSPYLILSQGSSGTDRSFMAAVGLSLASFKPQTKKTLVQTGFLMPTVQKLLRSTQNHLDDRRDYVTGKAHPTVFSSVNLTGMMKAAHSMTPREIPPLAQVRVLEEDVLVPGRDFVAGGGRNEKLCETPCVIGRVFRGHQFWRRIVVSAEDSIDLGKRGLSYHWVILRGDPTRIKIIPRNRQRSVVDLRVGYHPKRPINWQPALESNRVDIGVFVHNGLTWSAPAFVCFFSLANERRIYNDQRQIVEIDYSGIAVVDSRLSRKQDFKDVFKYAGGKLTGYVRHHKDGRKEEHALPGPGN